MNYLRMYQTDLHQMFRIDMHVEGIISFAIV